MRVHREIVDSLDKQDVLHSIGSDSEIDPEDVQEQYEEMSQVASAQYESSAIGMIHSVLCGVVEEEGAVDLADTPS